MLFQKADIRKKQIDGYGKNDKKRQRITMWDIRYTERNRSLKYILFRKTPKSGKAPSGKVSLCTFFRTGLKKASLTVEAALVLPLFFFGIVAIISFMDIYRVQTEHLTELCQSTKKAGMYAYVIQGGGKDEIALPDLYSIQPIGGVFPLPAVWIYNTVKIHAWTGSDYGNWNTGSDQGGEMVYVTEAGGVYHRNVSCRHLSVSVVRVSGSAIGERRNSQGGKYHACERCSRHQKAGGSVYITQTGNRYHNDADCSGLKRTVRMVRETDLSGMPVCSRCG